MSILDELNADFEALMTRCKATDVKIRQIREFEYDEKETVLSESKTYKHLIEYNGHTFLMETTLEFQQVTMDGKDGFVPCLKVVKVRPIDIEEKYDEEDGN